MELDEFEWNAMRTASGAKHRKTLAAIIENDALWGMFHAAMGAVTESAELIDVFKKFIAYKRRIDLVNADEEIGDLLWYIMLYSNARASMVRTHGIQIEKEIDGVPTVEWLISRDPSWTGADHLRWIMDRNVAKLKKRFPDKFDEVRANHRDLFEERKALEGQ